MNEEISKKIPFFHYLVSLILLFSAQYYTFLLGSVGKLFMLIAAFGLGMLFVIGNLSIQSAKLVVFVLIVGFCYLVMLTITYINSAHINILQFMFQIVNLCLFVLGGVIGASSHRLYLKISGRELILIATIIIPCCASLLSNANQLDFQSGKLNRNFDSSDLNPIGIAFNAGLLQLILLAIFLNAKNILERILTICSLGFVAFVMLSTGSRGAVLYLLITVIILVFLDILDRGNLSTKNLLFISLFAVAAVLVINFTKSEDNFLARLDLLVGRMSNAFEYFFGSSSNVAVDMSIDERKIIQQEYLSIWDQWFLTGLKGYDNSYPHNQILEWVLRFGVFGLVLASMFLSLFLLSLMYMLLNNSSTSVIDKIFFSLFAFAYLQSMTSLSLEMNRALFVGGGYFLGVLFLNRVRRKSCMCQVKNGSKAN